MPANLAVCSTASDALAVTGRSKLVRCMPVQSPSARKSRTCLLSLLWVSTHSSRVLRAFRKCRPGPPSRHCDQRVFLFYFLAEKINRIYWGAVGSAMMC